MILTVKTLIAALQHYDPNTVVTVHAEGVAPIEEIYATPSGIVLDAEYYGEPITFKGNQ